VPTLCALGAIALWASLATLGVALSHVSPFLLTGLGLLVGSVPAWPLWRQWRVPTSTLALGIYGLFGFHFLLFLALRHAPAVEANLINYLWPLLIVVLAPWWLPDMRLRRGHVLAAALGFVGAGLAIAGDGTLASTFHVGYLAAFGSAVVWATYSLSTRRVATFPTAAVGLFGLVSGLLSLLCHVWLEPPAALSISDAGLILVMGLGPLGTAFFLWDYAMKHGDPRRIGVLSYLTPLGSTIMLLVVTGRPMTFGLMLATGLIVGAALLAWRQR